jgi:hypothetical protein
MRNVFLIWILFSFSFPGRVYQTPQSGNSDHDASIDEIIFRALPFKDLKTRNDFERRFGKPVSVSAKPFTNWHTSETDTVYKLVFKGLTIDLYEVARDHSIAVLRVLLTDNRWRFPMRLRIGDARQQVLQFLGNPIEDRTSEWVYVCADCVEENKITFGFSGDKIRTIQWDFALD